MYGKQKTHITGAGKLSTSRHIEKEPMYLTMEKKVGISNRELK